MKSHLCLHLTLYPVCSSCGSQMQSHNLSLPPYICIIQVTQMSIALFQRIFIGANCIYIKQMIKKCKSESRSGFIRRVILLQCSCQKIISHHEILRILDLCQDMDVGRCRRHNCSHAHTKKHLYNEHLCCPSFFPLCAVVILLQEMPKILCYFKVTGRGRKNCWNLNVF